MPDRLSPNAQKVQDLLAALGIPGRVVEKDTPTRTAGEAAAALGCTVAQIAKSLIFRGRQSGSPVLVIASGANRVDEALLAAALGEPVGRADPDFVKTASGFPIGGVPPLGHPQPIRTFIDADLLQHPLIWAAGGSPSAVFPITPGVLVQHTGGAVISIRGGG